MAISSFVLPVAVAVIFGLTLLALVLAIGIPLLGLLRNRAQPVTRATGKIVAKQVQMRDRATNSTLLANSVTVEFPDGSRQVFKVATPVFALLAEGDVGTATYQGWLLKSFEGSAVGVWPPPPQDRIAP
ncbi:MAG TPA: DUF2500 family protein [Dermatophilaceae bacterium]|nr:DUF2500 family protein [Dermatophilaceae bacterium]